MDKAQAAAHEVIRPPVYIRKVSGNALDLAKTEWLLTDGQGGFAMGTAAGIPTRRYHGWLVASMSPPVQRVLMLSSCVETLIENPGGPDEKRYDLSSFFFPDAVHPAGHASLTDFEAGTTVRWEYSVGGGNAPIRVTRELCLLRPEQRGEEAGAGGAAIVRYTVHPAGRRLELDVRPLVVVRDFHGLISGRMDHDRFIVSTTPGVVGVEVAHKYGAMPRMNLACDGARFVSGSQWWHDFEYPRDAERGQHHREDLLSPGSFLLSVGAAGAPSARAELVVWSGPGDERPDKGFDEAERGQRERAEGLIAKTLSQAGRAQIGPGDAGSAAIGALTVAGDAFVVRRATTGAGFSTSVIAGYPWFADWGRDTMIALPGLMLATGRFEEALKTLETFALLCKDGLIPNCFDDATGKPEYNTVDASLWFIHAACQYAEIAKDGSVLKTAVGRACREIIESYRRGTRHKIKMDDDGLIAAGDATTQLTWMDARRDGVVFTPRFGKPVEVNALWFNALVSLAGALEKDQPKTAREYRSVAERARASFVEKFWNPRTRSCVDCLVPDGSGTWRSGPETRPNQIFAASLPHSPLDAQQRAGVVECVRSRLLTPRGLRTLSPADPGYIGRYRGSLFERDRAYHNGTVWPYLIGAYAEAVLRVGGFSTRACAEVREVLRPLVAELDSGAPGRMLGQIAEVYDGDERAEEARQPGGCPAQAWSVSEVLRVMVMVGQPGKDSD